VDDDAAAVRAEWRAEEEAWTRAALERWEHGRGLADVLRDCVHRGDRVSFSFAAIVWAGAVIGVGRDVARLDTGHAIVDIRLAVDAQFVVRVQDGVARGGREHALTTFTARLRELDGTKVCIGTVGGPLEGRVRIGRDQLRLTGATGVAYVPTDSVGWVRPLDD
jgi:hypothetical protein